MPEAAQRLVAEAIGTFCLVFAGTSAIVVDASGGAVSHVGVALTFGLVVFAMIAAIVERKTSGIVAQLGASK